MAATYNVATGKQLSSLTSAMGGKLPLAWITFRCGGGVISLGTGKGESMANVTLVPLSPGLASSLSADAFHAPPGLAIASEVAALLSQVAKATLDHYARVPPAGPWCGYLVVDTNGQVVGTAAFVTPPSNGEVEIAYYTFPQYEMRGLATAAARALIEIAQGTDESLEVIAFKSPENNASTRVLERIGFTRSGEVMDEDIGRSWGWKLCQR